MGVMLAADNYFGVPRPEIFKARLTVEKILLRAVRDWARNANNVNMVAQVEQSLLDLDAAEGS